MPLKSFLRIFFLCISTYVNAQNIPHRNLFNDLKYIKDAQAFYKNSRSSSATGVGRDTIKTHLDTLFNGTNLNGWYAFTDKEKKQENAASVYTIADSMIRLNGEKIGYLMSKKSFDDFELTLEFRWNTEQQYHRNDNVKNSGVMYNIPTDAPDVLWPRGIQFQIKEGFTGDFVLLDSVTINVKNSTKPAGKSVVVSRFQDNEKPIGEWNSIRIVSKNGTCSQFLNGQLVNDGTDASSKKGRILLQYEGSPIDFRKIILKE